MKMKFKAIRYISIFLLFTGALGSCNQDDPVPQPYPEKRNYFPLEVGESRLYRVDSIRYSDFDTSDIRDSFSYFIYESIDSLTINGTDSTYWLSRELKIERDSRAYLTEIWRYVLSDGNLIQYANNRPNLKLIFPLIDGETWDLNLYNGDSLKEASFGVDTTFSLNNVVLSDVKQVIEEDEGDLLSRNYEASFYSKENGLVFYRLFALELITSEFPEPGIPWIEKANSGYIKEITLLEYNQAK